MKKGMKRFLGIVLAMVMMLSMSISVFAADTIPKKIGRAHV